MADEFTIAKDIKVELQLPNGTNAVWGLSKWNNSEKWGSASSLAWVDIVATVSRAEISLGGSVENGFYVPATPNTMNIQFQSMTYDPSNNKFIRPNTPIRFSYRQAPDTAPTTWTTVFNGFIDTFSVSYDAFGNNIVEVQASSSLKTLLAKNIKTLTVPSGQTVFDYVTTWASTVGATVSAPSGVGLMAGETFTETSSGEILDNVLQVTNGIVVQSPYDDSIFFLDSTQMRSGLSPTEQFSNVHSTATTHHCIADISTTYDMDTSFNYYVINSTVDATKQTSSNQDLVDLYGQIRCEQTLHLLPSNVTTWLASVTSKNPGRKVQEVTTPLIRRDGKITNTNELVPGNSVNVSLTQPTFTINQDLWITKTTHTIDPDNWFTTLELWKGF